MSSKLHQVAKVSAKGSFFLFFGNTFSAVILAINSILIARLLGPQNYGSYVVAMIIPVLFVTLSDIGISPGLTKFSAQLYSQGKNKEVTGLIKSGLILKSLFSLFSALILLSFSDSLPNLLLGRQDVTTLIRYATFYLFGQSIFVTLQALLIGLDNQKSCSLLVTIQAITQIIFSPLLIILGMESIGAVLGAGISLIVVIIIGLTLVVWRILPQIAKNKFDWRTDFTQNIRKLIVYGVPLFFASLMVTLFGQSQRIIMAQLVSDIEVGNYAIALNFSILVTLLAKPISDSILPAFSKFNKKEDAESINKLFMLSVKYTSALVIPLAIALSLLSQDVIFTLFGTQYQLAPNYLSLYSFSFLAVGLGLYIVSSFFNSQGDTRTTLKINVVKLITVIPLAIILTIFYRIPGLVISIIVAQFVAMAFASFMAHKNYSVTVDFRSTIKIIVASLCSAFVVFLLFKLLYVQIPIFRLILGGFLFIIAYLFFVPVFHVINKEDINNLEIILKESSILSPILKIILHLEKKLLPIRK